MWPITLSGRLTIIALVGRYPTNKLMVRKSILKQPREGPLNKETGVSKFTSGINTALAVVSQI